MKNNIQNNFLEGRKSSLFYDEGDVVLSCTLSNNTILELKAVGLKRVVFKDEVLKSAKDFIGAFKSDEELLKAECEKGFFIDSYNFFQIFKTEKGITKLMMDVEDPEDTFIEIVEKMEERIKKGLEFNPNDMSRYSLCLGEIESILEFVPIEHRTEVRSKMKRTQTILEFTRDDIENELARKYDNSEIDYDMTSVEFQEKVEEIVKRCEELGFDDTNDSFNGELEEIVNELF